MVLNSQQLMSLSGGASFWNNASLISAFIRGFQFVYGVGQAIGSAISRSVRRNYC